MKVIGIWANEVLQGKRTVAHALVSLIGKNKPKQKVLFVEFDKKGSFYETTKLNSRDKNTIEYLSNAIYRHDYEFETNIVQRDNLSLSDSSKSVVNAIPKNVDFLVFPKKSKEYQIPEISIDNYSIEESAYIFSQRVMEQLKQTNYDYIIISVPKKIFSPLALPILLHCDHVVKVITAHATVIHHWHELRELLQRAGVELPFIHVVNFTTNEIPDEMYGAVIDEENIFTVPFFASKLHDGFDLSFSNVDVENALLKILPSLDIAVEREEEKKGFFGKRKSGKK